VTTGAGAPHPAAPPVRNLANALTAGRLVLVPVSAIALLLSGLSRPGWQLVAAAAFAVAAVTDWLDGRIARARAEVTTFGKIADPIADKALTGTAFVLLSGLGAVPWWVTAAVLTREIGVTAIRFWVIRHGVIPASRGGKLKTGLQIVAVIALVLPLPAGPLHLIALVVMAGAVLVTLVTGVDYLFRALVLRGRGRDAVELPPTAPAAAPTTDGTQTSPIGPA
jgi:CDP-diacylglycerol--glycerol-3-phosphate 3-phosphatidyltransferase